MTYCGKRVPVLSSSRIGASTITNFHDSTNSVTTLQLERNRDAEFIWMRGYTSSKTASFKRTKRQALPMNPYYAYTFVIKDSFGVVIDKRSDQAWAGPGQSQMGLSISCLKQIDQTGTISNQVMSQAQQRALKKLSDLKFNAAQAFAERKQTADMLVKSVNRFVTFALLVRKGNFKEANKVLRSREGLFGGRHQYLPSSNKWRAMERRKPGYWKDHFTDIWLEYSYGWRPLLGDIYGAAELLAHMHLENKPSVVRGAAKRENLEVLLADTEGLHAVGNVKSDYKALCVLQFDMTDTALSALRQTGISNPALLAWELLPYSFVLDWFVPVGQYLENLNASAGLKFLRGSTSLMTKWDGSASTKTDGSVYSRCDPFTATLKAAQLYRVVHTDFPGAALGSFGYGLNWQQLTSAFSLINQLFQRR